MSRMPLIQLNIEQTEHLLSILPQSIRRKKQLSAYGRRSPPLVGEMGYVGFRSIRAEAPGQLTPSKPPQTLWNRSVLALQ